MHLAIACPSVTSRGAPHLRHSISILACPQSLSLYRTLTGGGRGRRVGSIMEPRTILHASPLLLCLATVVTAGCGGGPTYVTAQPAPETRTITVSGMARVELTPDEACVELTLASRNASMPVAHRELEAGLTALLAELRADRALRIERGTTRYAP